MTSCRARWPCSSSGPSPTVAGCTATQSPRTSSASRRTSCAWRKARSIPASTAWPRKAGCAPSGVSPRRTAKRASMPSPRQGEGSYSSRKRAGRGCAAACGACSATPEPSPTRGVPSMSWLARLRNVFRPDEVSDEIDREMAFHLAERTDELVAAGASPEEARREAQRRFGRYLLQKEDTRERDVLMWLETLLTDFRYGLRGLRSSPVFCLAAVLTLAIGIGANTAVFTLLHGLLLRSLPVPNPQELARIGLAGLGDSPPAFVIPYRMIQQLRQEQRSFVDLSAWTNQAVAVSDPDGTIHQYQAGLVSGNAFSLLGARPRLGRLIDTSDDVRGGPAQGWPAVVS